MSSPAHLSGFVLTFFRVLGATVAGKHSAVLEGLEGSVTDLDDADGDTPGEAVPAVESYGQLGIVARPRPPETIDGETMNAEGYGARTPAGMVPFARRDLRLNRRFPAPKPGSIACVGYGGGFLSFDDADGDTSLATWYVPYSRDGSGTPQKAHTITLDPTGQAINIVHGDGGQVVLLPGKKIMLVADGSTWAKLEPGKFDVQAAQISLIGSVFIGNPTGTVPLALQPSLTALETWASTHVHPTAMGPSGPPAVLPTPSVGATRAGGI